MNYIVYKVTFPNNKVYIGITSLGMKERKRLHYLDVKRNTNYKFHNALRKYNGTEIWEEFCSAFCWESAKELEKYFIQYYNSKNKGYNSTLGGDGTYGMKHSEESKGKMRGPRPQTSTALKNKPKSEEHKKALSISCIGRKLSENTKNKISKFMKKYKSDINIRNKAALSNGGKSFRVFKAVCIQKPTQNKKAIYQKLELIGNWISQRQCARDLKLNQSNIGKCLRYPNKNKVHKGYIFEYLGDKNVFKI